MTKNRIKLSLSPNDFHSLIRLAFAANIPAGVVQKNRMDQDQETVMVVIDNQLVAIWQLHRIPIQ